MKLACLFVITLTLFAAACGEEAPNPPGAVEFVDVRPPEDALITNRYSTVAAEGYVLTQSGKRDGRYTGPFEDMVTLVQTKPGFAIRAAVLGGGIIVLGGGIIVGLVWGLAKGVSEGIREYKKVRREAADDNLHL